MERRTWMFLLVRCGVAPTPDDDSWERDSVVLGYHMIPAIF